MKTFRRDHWRDMLNPAYLLTYLRVRRAVRPDCGRCADVAERRLAALTAAGYVVVPREAVAAATTFMLATEGHMYPSDERHLATLVDALSPVADPSGNAPSDAAGKAT